MSTNLTYPQSLRLAEFGEIVEARDVDLIMDSCTSSIAWPLPLGVLFDR